MTEKTISEKFTDFFCSGRFNAALLAAGVILRLKHYFENRSLWLDEAYVAVGIASRSFEEIFKFFAIFPDRPREPLFFSLIEKGFVANLGNHEYALRLFPLIAAIISLFLFNSLLKVNVKEKVRPIALALFVFCEPLIYYAAELKPYSCDVMFVLIFYFFMRYIQKRDYDTLSMVYFGLLGSISIWFSHACLFILAGMGLISFLRLLSERDWLKIFKLFFISWFWFASFLLLYKVSLSQMLNSESNQTAWPEFVFMPLPFSFKSIAWIKFAFFEALGNPVGISFPLIFIFILILGCHSYFKRGRMEFFLLTSPLLVALGAAMAQKYPFSGRMLLFTVPAFVILLSEGVVYLTGKVKTGRFIIGLVLCSLLFYQPLKNAVFFLTHSRDNEQTRDVMEYFSKQYMPGDTLFMNPSAQYPFWYYASNMKFSEDLDRRVIGIYKGEKVEGVEVWQFSRFLGNQEGIPFTSVRTIYHVFDGEGYFRRILVNEKATNEQVITAGKIDKVSNSKRAWLILSRVDPDIRNIILGYFNNVGRQVTKLEKRGAAIYLYDLH